MKINFFFKDEYEIMKLMPTLAIVIPPHPQWIMARGGTL